MLDPISIREYGSIYKGENRSDFSSNRAYLNDQAFNNLVAFIEENAQVAESALNIRRKGGQQYIYVKNYVGIIETSDGTSIEILPKIFGNEQSKNLQYDAQEVRKIFLKMLKRLKNSPYINISKAHLKAKKFTILEVFITAFLDELDKLFKQGIKNDYIPVQRNTSFLKGRLLFNKHLKKNLVNKQRFYNEYEQFVNDIPHNRLIKSTLFKLLHKSQNNQNLRQIRHFLGIFDEIPASSSLEQDFIKTEHINRNFKHYDLLLKWAKVFLLNQSFTNFRGSHINFALLFPMERIFEDYTSYILKQEFPDWTISTQVTGKYLIENHNNRSIFGLRPDIVMEKDSVKYILDAKWKILNQKDKRFGIKQSDLYQLFAYGEKFKEDDQYPNLFLIYPKVFEQELETFEYYANEDKNLRLFVLQLDVINDRLLGRHLLQSIDNRKQNNATSTH